MLYTWSQKLDAKLLQILQSISAKAQLDSKTEVETTYHEFFGQLNSKLNDSVLVERRAGSVPPRLTPITSLEWGSLTFHMDSKVIGTDALASTYRDIVLAICDAVFEKVFASGPYNADLPRKLGINATGRMSHDEFKNFIINCPTKSWLNAKWTVPVYSASMYNNKHEIIPVYLSLRSYYGSTVKTYHNFFANKIRWKNLDVHVLLDLFLTMKVRKDYGPIISRWLTSHSGDSKFYDPVWIACYVLVPANTIATLIVNKYVEQNPITGSGSRSKVFKGKLWLMVKQKVVYEYLNTLCLYDFNLFKLHNKYVAVVDKHHQDQLGTMNAIENPRQCICLTMFVELLFLTLPEYLEEDIIFV